jgi:hypothetical protein
MMLQGARAVLWGSVVGLVGCGGSGGGASTPAIDAGAETAAPAVEHAIVARVALSPDPDGKHVTFATQNGSTVAVAISDIAGKTVYWATAAGGDSVLNTAPIDVGATTIGADLTSSFTTPAHYADGPWEVACVIAVSGKPPGPNPGDLAAFDDSAPPAGDPPPTGVSVRVHVEGADASLTMGNRYFIRFGNP